jgi:hypothetical protein
METIPVRFPGTRADAMMGDVEPDVSRVIKRRWELAAGVNGVNDGNEALTGQEFLDGI